MTIQTTLLKTLVLILLVHIPLQAALVSDFRDFSLLTQPGGSVVLPGRLYTPPKATSGPRPLILFLHGSGAAGTNNVAQLNANIDNLLAEAKRRGAFLYAPQTASTWADRSTTDQVMSMIARSKVGFSIIGGEFSGTMAAVNLARFSQQPLKVMLINAKRPFGRGTAYGTARREHLLNVAARNMSAFPDYPNHYFDWLRSQSEFNTVPDSELREMFVPRMVHGDYIRSLAETHLRPEHSRFNVQFEMIDDEATDIIWDGSDNVQVVLSKHDLDMGIKIDDDFAVLDKDSKRVGNLFAIGPLLKGTLWETIAVPELRGQAMRVAEVMLDQMPTSLKEENVIEYCI